MRSGQAGDEVGTRDFRRDWIDASFRAVSCGHRPPLLLSLLVPPIMFTDGCSLASTRAFRAQVSYQTDALRDPASVELPSKRVEGRIRPEALCGECRLSAIPN